MGLNFDFLLTFIDYPNAATIHALQGVLAGYLITRAIFKKEISDSLCALFIMIGFAIYEITEQWKENDAAYEDFEVFWVAAMLTGLVYTVVHLWWHYFRREPLVKIDMGGKFFIGEKDKSDDKLS